MIIKFCRAVPVLYSKSYLTRLHEEIFYLFKDFVDILWYYRLESSELFKKY